MLLIYYYICWYALCIQKLKYVLNCVCCMVHMTIGNIWQILPWIYYIALVVACNLYITYLIPTYSLQKFWNFKRILCNFIWCLMCVYIYIYAQSDTHYIQYKYEHVQRNGISIYRLNYIILYHKGKWENAFKVF